MTPDEIEEYKRMRKQSNLGKPKLFCIPCTLTQANRFVENMHRNHEPTNSGRFAIAVITSDGIVHGVAIVGNTIARALDDGLTAEVLRCCTDTTPNACSALYGACWRAAKSMGYRSMYTFTLGERYEETGGSLRAMGWKPTEGVGGSPWNHKGRPGKGLDAWSNVKKVRWEVHDESFFPIEEVKWPEFKPQGEAHVSTLFDIPYVESQGVTQERKRVKRAAIRNRHEVNNG